MKGMLDTVRALLAPWPWLMAWRESRRHRGRLLVFSSSIVLGVAAMVAVGSFGSNLSDAIEDQAKTLLGADLEVSTRVPFTEKQRQFLESFGAERSYQISFSSMIRFPTADATRLGQVRVLEGGFPYYGKIEAVPTNSVSAFRQGQGVLVEENLLLQYEVQVGDPVRIGTLETTVIGALQNVPGENMMLATVAPRVFMPSTMLSESGLLGNKSIARYRYYYRFETDEDRHRAQAAIDKVRRDYRWSTDDVAERKRELGNSLRNLYRFLNLASFVALLLGAIGIASAIQLHIRQKLSSVAVLRCLGTSNATTFAIYLIQAMALGCFGVALGTLAGLLVQQFLPLAFADFLPLEMENQIQLLPIARATLIGLGITLLFTLLPLLPVRRVPPMRVLRTNLNPVRDRAAEFTIYVVILIAITLFAISQSDRWYLGIAFTVSLAAVLGLLYAVALGISRTMRALVRPSWPFVLRQGIASLYRPNNRTSLLMLSLGLGTFLILTLHLTQHGLVQELFPEAEEHRTNAILFDVQSDQVPGIESLLTEQGLPVLGVSPIVSMRIASINGRTTKEIQADPSNDSPGWALRREYRVTYRTTLSDSETVVAGEWIPSASFDDPIIPISFDAELAEDLHIGLGDRLEFDVQGLPVMTTIASLREIDWRRIQANFFVVFPDGVLNDAPGFNIIATHVPDTSTSAKMQRQVTEAFPNVSTVDLMLVLNILNDVIGKISFGIRFMAFFTALTGLMLLITATLNSRYQRIHESIQLRTLGASRKQILLIQLTEYGVLGGLASLTGTSLAISASWALARFVFEVSFHFPLVQVLTAVGVSSLLTIAIGIIGSWGITTHSPLALLRQET